jgi:RimJ/RimL family protein N-acetyltransferase
MQIRPMNMGDMDRLGDIDATVESADYLHLEITGEGMQKSWRLEQRPMREKRIAANPLSEDARFLVRQCLSGTDEGVLLVAEHEGMIVGLLVARPDPDRRAMRLIDVRIDYDFRRQGVGTAMLFQLIQNTRQADLRAVTAQVKTNNHPANAFLAKCGFDLAGVNTHRDSNHDLVKEEVTLYWYAALD